MYKYTDWDFIGLNPFSSKSEGSDHQKKMALEPNFQRQVKAIKAQIKPRFPLVVRDGTYFPKFDKTRAKYDWSNCRRHHRLSL